MSRLITTILAFTAVSFVFSASAQSVDESEAELQAVGSAIDEIESWLLTANGEASDDEKELQLADEALSEVSMAITDIQESIDRSQQDLVNLQSSIVELEENKLQQSQLIHSILRSLYMRGEEPALKTLLDQSGSSNSNRMLHYSAVLSDAQLVKIAEYEQLLEQLSRSQHELATVLTSLSDQRSELGTQQLALNSARTQQQVALDKLREQISSQNEELEQLEINQAELQQLIEEIRVAMEGIRSFADVPAFTNSRGQLPLPVPGTISNRFGERYSNGVLERQGITIGVERGTAVQSIHPGHVVFADWLRGSGLLVIVDHGEGFMSLYGGNEALSASAGNWVDAGEVLATSGSAINSNEASLYFEIRQHGEPQNPENWLNID